jgi:hypothetical protein
MTVYARISTLPHTSNLVPRTSNLTLLAVVVQILLEVVAEKKNGAALDNSRPAPLLSCVQQATT